MERFWYLKKFAIFEGLSPEECSRLESQAVVRKFGRKELVYFPSDPGNTVLLLFEGRVMIKSITPEGKEAILAIIEPGEVFGELALMEEGKRNEFAEAVLDSVACAIPREAMLDLIGNNPKMALRITKLMGLKLQRIANRVKDVLFRSFKERLVSLILELGERYGVQKSQGLEIDLKLSHQEMANLIGATRETVTITLGELRSEGCIDVTRRRITLVDRPHLLAIKNGSV